MSLLKVWDRTSQFVSISVVFLKGSLSWRLSGLFPHPCHTTCPGRDNEVKSQVLYSCTCLVKACQNTWFSPVAKLPRNSELPAGQHPNSGCVAESGEVLISRGWGRAHSPTVWCRFWYGIQWSLCCLSDGGDGTFWLTWFSRLLEGSCGDLILETYLVQFCI